VCPLENKLPVKIGLLGKAPGDQKRNATLGNPLGGSGTSLIIDAAVQQDTVQQDTLL